MMYIHVLPNDSRVKHCCCLATPALCENLSIIWPPHALTPVLSSLWHFRPLIQNLQNESEELAVQLTRVQASKTEELTNARSMVEQQKHELEAVKGRNVRRQSFFFAFNGRKD